MVQQIMGDEFSARFDLGKGPLIRGRLIGLGTEDHVLLITMHHIISDGWSIGIFLQELRKLYRAFHAGEPSPLAPLALQYADYAMWQRHLLSGALLEEQQKYWREQLADVPPLLSLPTDRPRPARQDFSGDAIGFELDAELTAALRKLSKTHHATLYMTLLAAWSLLMLRMSGQSGVTIGTPCANRARPELEELIGLFTNMLALRIGVDASTTVGELLARVKATFLAAQQHEHLPFEQIVELVQPERSIAYNPLFQVMFVWEGLSHGEGFGLPGLFAESMQPTGFRTAKFDLTLALSERELTIGGSIEFATALFDRDTIERFVGYFIGLLRGMVGNPSQYAARLPMLPDCESQQILHDWNETALAFPSDCFGHQWIEQQALRSPDAVAIRSGGDALTYAQLDLQSNRLARHLRALGVGPEERVGLCVERGPAMIVGLLAVHKAGGAYVPMDPAYPADRLRVMLDDSAPVVLLTQRHLVERFAYPGHIVDVDDAGVWAPESSEPLAPAEVGLRPDSLAYIIYTSGSTGTPKGVMLEHTNLMHFLAWGRSAFSTQALARTLAATSLSFDLAVFECLLPLTCGQTVHIAADVLELAEQDFSVTLINTVPSAMEALLDVSSLPARAGIASLAGEPLKPSLVERIFERSQVDAVYNLYGPTETTTYSTVARIARGETFTGHIGRPIANTRIYILDAHGQPVPVGVTGELHIGGAGVARGYFNRAELTTERFVNDPFANDHGARMYRTGDFARWLPDGTIEFLGRVDHQVKLRGYRIELGEIERVLESYDGVQRAVVMVREDRPGIKQLVAYVVPVGDSVTDALRLHAEGRLPAYMLPAVYLELPNLPLTPNGKLDRKALPVPKDVEVTSRSPRTPQERAIVALFSEVLGLADVGVDDSFFDLGGHSLLAMRLVSQLRSKIGLDISLRTLFESSTPAALAQHAGAAPDERPVLRPAVNRPACVPLSYAQQRLYFLDQLEGPSATYNLPVVWRLRGKIDADAMHAAVNDLVARHESLRSLNLELGGQAGQLILGVEQGRPAFIRESVEPQALQAAIDRAADHRFRLQSEIPLRSWLFRVDEQDHVLLLLFHHIACDGGSMGPLLRDMSFAYAARCEGRSPEWTPLAVQYPDYALWQRQWLGDETDANSVLAAQINYWRNALQGLPDCIALPVDRPRPTQATYRGDVVSADVDQGTHARLLELAHEERVTFFMLMHAAVALLLHTLGAGDDISIGAPSAGRNDDTLEPLIGFFVNMLTLRTDLSGNPTFREMLGRVRGADLEAYSHADLPFDRVVEIVKPSRTTSHHPLFQVMLVLNRADEESVRMHDLAVTSLDANSDTAKFDLTFHVGEKRNAVGTAGGLELHVEYAVDLFERATAEAFMTRLVRLLQAVSQSADSLIDDLTDGKSLASPGINPSLTGEARPKRTDLPEGVVRLKKGGGEEPLFLVHPIGGSAFCYAQLTRLLITERSVYGLETIVRDASSPFADLASMAQAYVQRVRTLQPAGPYWLGGWSMGGLLAWEMAQQLKAQGEEVALLAMLDTFPPEVMPKIDPDRLHQYAIAKLRADLTESLVEQAPDDADGIVKTLEALRVLLVEQGLVDQGRSSEELARMLAAYEQNFWAMQNYEVRPFDQKLLLFAAEAGVPDYLSSAWNDYSLGQAQCHGIAANHYTLMKADAIRVIANELSGRLDQSRYQEIRPEQGDRVTSAEEDVV
jgi:amino acid adenylation domain-containing protein